MRKLFMVAALAIAISLSDNIILFAENVASPTEPAAKKAGQSEGGSVKAASARPFPTVVPRVPYAAKYVRVPWFDFATKSRRQERR